MQGMIEQYGRKSINRGYVEILRRVAQWSRSFKQSTVGYAPGKRTWNALKWYEDELERVKEAILEAEERKEESHSVLSSMKLGKSSADSHVAKIHAKMASAEIKARQLEMEEEQRTKEFAKQLEIKHKIEQAGNVAQRIELEAKERRKTQEAKDETARLAAEW